MCAMKITYPFQNVNGYTGLKLNHVSKGGHMCLIIPTYSELASHMYLY